HVLFSAPSEDYVANRPLDVNNYGFITRANYITKVKEFSNYDFTKNSLFTISLSDITIPSKKNPGTSVSDIKSGLITLGFEVADGVDAEGTPDLLDALKEFQGKAISLGFTKTIKITSMKRSGSGEGLHGDGNAADIHTTSLTADERLVLIRAAIETGFGEIYHGTDSVTNGITSEENKKFRCFWYPDHADHLHIALENKKQDEPHGWEREGCITSAPLVASN
ncbi:hypothetical protein HYX13_01950, partial [Candidatus Woesearchaeota archaeon]|nr:hypothetical protein [Candidatus Woesearchaeota archaeon]